MSRSNYTTAAKVSARTFTYIVVIGVAILCAIPILWALFVSLLDYENAISFVTSGKITGVTLDNYKDILSQSNILKWIGNSFLVAISQTVLYLFIASMAAFGFCKLKWHGRNTIFWICMVSMLVPGIINFVPNFVIINKLGLYNNQLALILPGLSGVFGVFLLRQYMMNIPKDYLEAARVDGANNFYIYFRIVLPMCGPALASLAIFTFQGAWNDFLWPLIATPDNLTLTAGIYNEFNSSPYYGIRMAAAIISAVPIIVVFLFGQKYFTEGLNGGIKG